MASAYTVADALAAALKRHGVEVVFGQSTPSALILALPEFGIRQLGYRTENAGGIMADGYARISRKVGVVCAQNGTAATLLVPPLAEALKASIPIVTIVQDVPRSSTIPVDPFPLMCLQKSLIGSNWFTAAEGEDMAVMADAGTLNLGVFEHVRFSLDQVNEAVEAVEQRTGGFTNVVIMHGK